MDIKKLLGRVLTKVEHIDDAIFFHCSDGDIFKMHHRQKCCESVYVDDIVGDLSDLVGAPIIKTSEDVNIGEAYKSYTWTFYNLATLKGYVTIRWYGTSNGNYSEAVDFELI